MLTLAQRTFACLGRFPRGWRGRVLPPGSGQTRRLALWKDLLLPRRVRILSCRRACRSQNHRLLFWHGPDCNYQHGFHHAPVPAGTMPKILRSRPACFLVAFTAGGAPPQCPQVERFFTHLCDYFAAAGHLRPWEPNKTAAAQRRTEGNRPPAGSDDHRGEGLASIGWAGTIPAQAPATARGRSGGAAIRGPL